ncbi:hypothetical protein QBC39DRAFT_329989 [Podospora conica]|nr:hypothetical protein QBC39DRAFT_329989 [Schizothecium conicum]
MPHRVANFFRASTSSFENQVSNLAKKTTAPSSRRRPSPGGDRDSQGSGSSERLASSSSSIDENQTDIDDAHSHSPRHAPRPKMSESRSSSFTPDSHKDKDKDHGHHHRLSFPIHFGRSSREPPTSPLCSVDWKLESPPIVLYGDAEHSTGALVSGQLFLFIKEEKVEIESFDATLSIHVTQKKPFANHCNDCSHDITELKKWTLLPNPLVLTKGEHSFPFSVLLEGHLPATMDGALNSISYQFKAEAIPRNGGAAQPPVRFEKLLDVKRSLLGSDLPHHSVRVFPPTNIKASAHYPHIIHPIGSNTLTLRLDGISQHNAQVGTVEYWRLKKLTWRLEEISKTVAPACGRHSPRLEGAQPTPEQKKGVPRTDTRTIGEKTMFSGWKSNYMSTTDSNVELELEYSLGKHAKYVCDTKSRDGTEVTHQLMVELVVSQEWAPINRPTFVTHTGVGRILRMHFGTILTERGGIGISWDNEAPPIYQDVPPSPPAYSHATVVDRECSIADVMETLDGPSTPTT